MRREFLRARNIVHKTPTPHRKTDNPIDSLDQLSTDAVQPASHQSELGAYLSKTSLVTSFSIMHSVRAQDITTLHYIYRINFIRLPYQLLNEIGPLYI